MKKHFTATNIIAVLIAACLLVLLINVFAPGTTTAQKDFQDQIDRIRIQQEQEVRRNLIRDSLLLKALGDSDRVRTQTIYTIQKQRDEKIDRINRPDFDRDSLRRAFAEQ